MRANALIFGASYGSLLGIKLVLAGYDATLVCRAETARIINRDGIRVRMPLDDGPLELDSRGAPGRLRAASPYDVKPGDYDLVALAMQEPQYASDEVRELLDGVATAHVPCVSIMNIPPLPYLRRIPGIDVSALSSCYTDATVWTNFRPDCMTLCSPDPQAFRPADGPRNMLQVGLPTNFKAARFAVDEYTELLRRIQADIEAVRYGDDNRELPVKLKVHDSLFVPFAKWPMLVTGNYRCVQRDGVRSIRDAVHGDVEASRKIYEWAVALCVDLGASLADLVPFEKYAAAAQRLTRPSSAAAALARGAKDIERVDRLVQTLGVARTMRSTVLDETVELVDAWLAANRKGAMAASA
jgi:hypothetical protein